MEDLCEGQTVVDRQPSWADLNVAPAAKPSKLKIAGIGCGTLFGGLVILGIIGNLIGPPKTTPVANSTTSSAPASSPAPSVTPTTIRTTAPRPSATKPTAKAAPAAAQLAVNLMLSGGLTGSARKVDNVLPVKTGAHYDYNTPEGSTQCVMPADDGGWSATMAFRADGLSWEVIIDGSPLGEVPKPGAHQLVDENARPPGADASILTVWVGSDKDPQGSNGGSGIGTYQFSYYLPIDHNEGTGSAVIDKDLTSGTLDVWLTPSMTENLEFHLTGRWSCR